MRIAHVCLAVGEDKKINLKKNLNTEKHRNPPQKKFLLQRKTNIQF